MIKFDPLGVDYTAGFWKKDNDKQYKDNYRVYAERVNDVDVKGYNHDDFNCDVEHVLMQYTGLKDKNGVEIYEGDILLIYDTNPVNDNVENEISHVHWSTERAGYVISNYSGEGFDNHGDVEVIGNIHKNPELLK